MSKGHRFFHRRPVPGNTKVITVAVEVVDQVDSNGSLAAQETLAPVTLQASHDAVITPPAAPTVPAALPTVSALPTVLAVPALDAAADCLVTPCPLCHQSRPLCLPYRLCLWCLPCQCLHYPLCHQYRRFLIICMCPASLPTLFPPATLSHKSQPHRRRFLCRQACLHVLQVPSPHLRSQRQRPSMLPARLPTRQHQVSASHALVCLHR